MSTVTKTASMVIVAIPDENDRVWKISSEKIPHLTLLFLGDADQVDNADSIVQFVEHAANRSLNRFYLPVDRRDELGKDKADVLFFKKNRYDFKALHDFRSLLLKDSNIKTAYDATSQFEFPDHVGAAGQPWIPHLTLGYPNSPAKSMPDDWSPMFFDVQFNKIGVWMGDYDGPEFTLKDYWDDMDEIGMDTPLSVAMSQLEHHGVKGMKWGVRKVEGGGEKAHIKIHTKTGQAQTSSSTMAKLIAPAMVAFPLMSLAFLSPRVRAEVKAARAVNKGVQADKKWKKEIDKGKKAIEVHNTAADEINQKVGAFNNDKRWKDVDLTKDPAKQAAYDKAVERELLNPAFARAAIKVHGANSPGGRYKFEIKDSATATVKVRDLGVDVAGSRTAAPAKRVLSAPSTASSVTKRVIKDHNELSDADFKRKYQVSKQLYAKRVDRYGDPYMNSPLAKAGKKLSALKHADEPTDVDAVGGPETAEDAEDEITVEFNISRDSNGFITGFTPADDDISEDTLVQTMDLGAAWLAHYGVKGMKWGVRRERGTPGFFETKRAVAEAQAREKRTPIAPRVQDSIGTSERKKTTISAKGGEDHPAAEDALKVAASKQKLQKSGVNALSNKELKDLAQRLNLETQVSVLMDKRKNPGQKFIETQLLKAQQDPIGTYKKAKPVVKGAPTAFRVGKTLLKTRRLAGIP